MAIVGVKTRSKLLPEEEALIERVRKDERRLLMPDSSWMKNWDALMLFLLVQLMFFLPFQLGVSGNYIAFTHVGLQTYNMICSFIFWIDTFLPFFRAYYDKRGFLVLHHKLIARKYLCSTFIPNLLSLVPSSGIYYFMVFLPNETDGASDPQHRWLQILKFLDFLKFVRLTRLPGILNRSELVRIVRSHTKSHYLLMLKVCIVLIIIVHWIACFWCLVAVLESGFDYGASQMLYSDNWISHWYNSTYDQYPPASARALNPIGVENAYDRYALSLFWSVQTLTSIGYGNISPFTATEFWIGSILQLIAGVCWAYLIGAAVNIASALQAEAELFRQEMDSANSLISTFSSSEPIVKKETGSRISIRSKRVPKIKVSSCEEVKQQIRQFIYNRKERANHKHNLESRQEVPGTFEVLDHLPKGLRGSACYYLVKSIIEHVPYLVDEAVPIPDLISLAEKCIFFKYAKGSVISFSEHDPERGIFIVVMGSGIISGEGAKLNVFNVHSVFNEAQLFLGDENQFNCQTNVAFLNYSELLFIPNDAINLLFQSFPVLWKTYGRYRYLKHALLRRPQGDQTV